MNPQISCRKLLFIDCDSTLSAIEGIDELARAKGGTVFSKVVALTNAAMNGEVPIHEVFARRMEMIRPERALCDEVAAHYIEAMVSGAQEFIAEAKADGWLPVVLSGGFAPMILPLAAELGIGHVEAVPLYFNEDGSYADYGADYPTTRNLGKNEIIRAWRNAEQPGRVVMVGDGVSDLETKPDVDLFVGFGGVVARPAVRDGCDFWLSDMRERSALWAAIRW
jgi:HAD superfamily phosphoserine phosphatase-like hydrolase